MYLCKKWAKNIVNILIILRSTISPRLPTVRPLSTGSKGWKLAKTGSWNEIMNIYPYIDGCVCVCVRASVDSLWMRIDLGLMNNSERRRLLLSQLAQAVGQ